MHHLWGSDLFRILDFGFRILRNRMPRFPQGVIKCGWGRPAKASVPARGTLALAGHFAPTSNHTRRRGVFFWFAGFEACAIFSYSVMGLHFWLIPALVILAVCLSAFYLIVRFTGGTGVRTEGRTLVDKPDEDEDRTGG